MGQELTDFLPVARRLTLAAGKRVMELFTTDLIRERKADQSLVTNADRDANEIIISGLRSSFPSHGILSEETGLEGPTGAEFLWIVDPLDGTKAFSRRISGFSVMVGLARRGMPVLGVVHDPLNGYLYEALRGGGCFSWTGASRLPARVSARRDFAEMPIIMSSDFPQRLVVALKSALPSRFVQPINSVGVKVGYLVRGEADIYLNNHPMNYWDSCAPLVILEEAGGRMTDWTGAPLSYSSLPLPPEEPSGARRVLEPTGNYRHLGPTLATNGQRHEELMQLLTGIR